MKLIMSNIVTYVYCYYLFERFCLMLVLISIVATYSYHYA